MDDSLHTLTRYRIKMRYRPGGETAQVMEASLTVTGSNLSRPSPFTIRRSFARDFWVETTREHTE